MVPTMEAQRDTQNKNLTIVDKSSKKRKRESALGISKNEEEKTPSKILKTSEIIDSPRASRNQDEMLPETEEGESAEPNSDIQLSLHSETKCCKKKCIHVVNFEVKEKLNQEYKELLNQSREHGRSYLRKYFRPYNWEKNSKEIKRNTIILFRIPPRVPFVEGDKKNKICQKAFMKIFELREDWAPWLTYPEYDYIQIKLEMKEELPLSDDDVYEKGEPAKETETMSMTQNDFNSATDGVQMIPKIKEEPVEYTWVDVKTEPTLETHCRCINSAPIHFNSESEENFDQFKKMTNWSLYGIQDDTLEVLFNEDYNSVLTLESIDLERDLQEIFGDEERSQIRHFVESLNCRKHRPVYSSSEGPVVNNISVHGGPSLYIGNVQNNREANVTSPSQAGATIGRKTQYRPPYDTQGTQLVSNKVTATKTKTIRPINTLYDSHLNNKLLQACQVGSITEVNECLRQGTDVNCRSRDWSNRTALHHASASGHDKVCQVLLQAGADVHTTAQHKATALHLASRSGRDNVCEVLLQAGADVHATTDTDKETALHTASASGHDKVCQVLLQAGADVHATDIYKQTSLHHASKSGHDKVCQVLLQAGADVHAAENYLKKTSLHLASVSGHDKVCQVLMQAGADVHATDTVLYKQTALHFASDSGHDKVCQVLLQAGADVHATDGFGKKPIDVIGDTTWKSVSADMKARTRQVLQSAMDKKSATEYYRLTSSNVTS